jgi:hypothetical protein
MRALACLVLLGGCLSRSPSSASDAELRERFRADHEGFERLRDALLANPQVKQVRVDSFDEPYPCDWKFGCVHWIDREPTPADLERTMALPAAWGRSVLGALHATGARAVAVDGDGVEIWMRLSGIIPSGSTKSIVWSPSGRAPLVDDTERVTTPHGRQYARLAPDWYLSLEWN